MGRDRFKRRKGQFIMVYKDLLNSPAWKSLSNAARVAYLHIRLDENGHNDGHLKLPYSQAVQFMDKKTFTRALKQLQDRGIIEVTKHGGLFNQCAEYGLSNVWRSWQPTQAIRSPHKKRQR